MATNIASQLVTISGVTWMDIYVRPATGAKTLTTITEAEWQFIGGAREGTFNFIGDDMTITDQKYENGQNIVSTTQDGTYAAEADMPNIAREICELLLRMEDIDVSGAASGSFMENRTAIGYGDFVGIVENCMFRFRFEESPEWEYMVYPNAKVASRLTGAGTSTDLLNIHMNITTSKSTDADTLDKYYVLVSKATTP